FEGLSSWDLDKTTWGGRFKLFGTVPVCCRCTGKTSSKNQSKLLESQVSDKTGLGYDSQVFDKQVFDYEELHDHESDNSVPKSPENDRYKTCEGYHVVPPPYTRIVMPLKPDLVFNDAPTANETEIKSVPKQKEPSFVPTSEHMKTPRESVKKVEHPKQVENLRTNHQKSKVRMTHPHSNRNVVPIAVLTRSRLVSLNAARPVSTAVPQSAMKSPRPVKYVVNKVVVSEDVIRRDLRLDDADGVEYFSNERIFAELARMGYEKPPPKMTFYKAAGKVFSRVETPLFPSMLVPPQPQAAEEDEVEMPTTPTPPYPTNVPSPPLQDPTLTPPASPPQEQPTTTTEFSMSLLTTLMETCAILSKKITELEQDKHTQALEILKLKKRGKIEAIDTDEDITLVDVKTQVDMDAELQERIDQDVSVVEPTVFDDDEVTMTMDKKLIKMKAEKAKLFDEKMTQRAQVLQKQYDDTEENIDWNAIAKQIQEKHLDNIRKYQSLKKKPVSIAQARKNMIIYLKNMAGYKMEHFRGMTYDKVKYPIIDWEIHSEGSRTYWKIITVGEITEAYQSFEDMLKGFNKEDIVTLWNLVKEKFSSALPIVDKQKALWVELKRLFEPDADDVLWKLQRYMHYPITWKLYTNCGVHKVSSTTRMHDMFMLTKKDYPLSNRVMTLMLSAKLQVKEDSEMARDLVMKIFMEANKPKSRKFSFRIDSKSLNKVSILVVLDLSKVANPLYSLRDKDLLKSNDPQKSDGHKLQDTMGDTSAHTRTKTAQQTKIDGLEMRVKKLEKKHMPRTHKLKRLYKVGLTARVISSYDDESLDQEDTSKQGRIDAIDADENIALVSTHDDVSTQDNIVQDEGIEDVGKEEVDEVVTTAKMIIDVVVDAAQVTTAIADIPVSAAETIVTNAPTITAESKKTNVEVTQAPKRKGAMIQEPKETTTTKIASSQQPQESTKKAQAEITQEESSKREGDEPEQERSKKQKVEDDKESEELKNCLGIITDDGDDVTIDATPLSIKSLTIVDYKIYKEGKKSYIQIFIADGNSQMYLTFSKMLKIFDREDLEALWRIVKDRFVKTMQWITWIVS
nr:hypothetical protein [Tanacetum cinerariifolium]